VGEKKMGEESSHEDRAPALEKLEDWEQDLRPYVGALLPTGD